MLIAWWLLGFDVVVLVMAVPNAIVAYFVGKRALTERQSLAIHRVQRGIVKL